MHIVKLRQLLQHVGLRLSMIEGGNICCRHVTAKRTAFVNIDENTWVWLRPILEEVVALRKIKGRQPRPQQDFTRDTTIVAAHDHDHMTFVDIASVYGITPARVRQLYLRRKAQQENNRQKVRLHVGFVDAVTGQPLNVPRVN